jgi:hypothetical protein
VRTLLLPVIVTGLIVAIPAVSIAAGPPSPAETVATRTVLPNANPLNREALRHEASSKLRVATARAKRKATPPAPPTPKVVLPPQLASIAQCESGGNPAAIGGGGLYRGKYQFSYSTWAGVGGSGDPAAAPEAEQDMRAALLYERSGPGQWPVCGS